MFGNSVKYKIVNFIKWAILLLLAIWLIHPIFYAVPVEGFSTEIINLGEDLAKGHIYKTDLLQPLAAEFFALSKLGVVWEISLLVKFFNIDGFTAMRIINLFGAVLLFSGCIILVRRWAKTSYFISIIAILAVAGISETSFFLSDNIIAAGLITIAFVLFYQKNKFLVILGGAIFGLGVLNRTDLILLIPVIPLVFYDRDGLKMPNIIIMLLAGMAALAVLQLPLLIFHVTFFDIINIGRQAIKLWARDLNYMRHGLEILVFLSVSGLVLALVGILALVQKKGYFKLGLLLLPVFVVNIISIGTMWQARQLLGLSPFLAALVAIGIDFLINQNSEKAIVPNAVPKIPHLFAALIFLLIGIQIIPYFTYSSDGPRYLYGGRLWAPIAWRNWQEQWNVGYNNIKDHLTSPTHGKVKIVISDYWNEDRYIHYALTDIGYNIDEKATKANCPKIAEFFRKDDNIIIHIRLHLTFSIYSDYLLAERFRKLAVPCINKYADKKYDNILYIGKKYENIEFLSDSQPQVNEFPLRVKTLLPVTHLNDSLMENRMIKPLINIIRSLPERLGIFRETLRIRQLDENGIKWLQGYYDRIAFEMAGFFPAEDIPSLDSVQESVQSRYKLD